MKARRKEVTEYRGKLIPPEQAKAERIRISQAIRSQHEREIIRRAMARRAGKDDAPFMRAAMKQAPDRSRPHLSQTSVP